MLERNTNKSPSTRRTDHEKRSPGSGKPRPRRPQQNPIAETKTEMKQRKQSRPKTTKSEQRRSSTTTRISTHTKKETSATSASHPKHVKGKKGTSIKNQQSKDRSGAGLRLGFPLAIYLNIFTLL
jgi:hypothetical protein